ncbi:MAG TPA: RNA 2',3'-cyclic phosphodiesterase [Candidatus Limnocylindrales bacterium]
MADGDQRLFIAVPIPDAAIDACRVLIDEVRAHTDPRGARWVGLDGLHVTLRFLGATAPALIPGLEEATRTAAGDHSPFDITLAGAGAFPEGRRPRALWIGIERGAEELAALVGDLQDPLAALGWPPDGRPFRPHLTVARIDAVHGTGGLAVADALTAAASALSVSFRASSVCLFRSHLGSGPASYECIGEVELGD